MGGTKLIAGTCAATSPKRGFSSWSFCCTARSRSNFWMTPATGAFSFLSICEISWFCCHLMWYVFSMLGSFGNMVFPSDLVKKSSASLHQFESETLGFRLKKVENIQISAVFRSSGRGGHCTFILSAMDLRSPFKCAIGSPSLTKAGSSDTGPIPTATKFSIGLKSERFRWRGKIRTLKSSWYQFWIWSIKYSCLWPKSWLPNRFIPVFTLKR